MNHSPPVLPTNVVTIATKVSVHYAALVLTSQYFGFENSYKYQNMASVALPYIFPSIFTMKFGMFVAAPALGYSMVSYVCRAQYVKADKNMLCDSFSKYINLDENQTGITSLFSTDIKIGEDEVDFIS